MIILRKLMYLFGLRPQRWHPEIQETGIRARWWSRMENVNYMLSYKSVSPFRVVR